MHLTPFDALWLAAAIRLAAPIALAALGELMSELGGVINIGLEGMMLTGAFFAFWVTKLTGNVWVGTCAAIGSAVIIGGIMAALTVYAQGDQIIVGVGINILALGLTTVIFRAITPGEGNVTVASMHSLALPGLSKVPGIGAALFNQPPLVYLIYLAVPSVWFILHRTSWGLKLRAAGEQPLAAEAAGASVRFVRSMGVLVAAGAAGCAGAMLSVGQLGVFVEGMSNGRGFLALAAVIFGRWRPAGVAVAGFVFGAADALQFRLQGKLVPASVWVVIGLVFAAWYGASARRRRRAAGRAPRNVAWHIQGLAAVMGAIALATLSPAWRLPSELWLALPYVVSLLVLAVARGKSRMPKALGVPYASAD